MKSRLIYALSLASLALQGCQGAKQSDTSNDDWILGAWTNQNTCTDEGIRIRENGIWLAYFEIGAWRLSKNELILTTIFDRGNRVSVPDENGFIIDEIDISTVRYKIISRDSNKSMITSGTNGIGEDIYWINCDTVAKSPNETIVSQSIADPVNIVNARATSNTVFSDNQTNHSDEVTCRGYLNDFEDGLGLRLVKNAQGDALTGNDACNAYIESQTPAFRSQVLRVCRVRSTCTIRGRVAMSSRATYYWWQSITDVSLR
jgi:hypothetical protein